MDIPKKCYIFALRIMAKKKLQLKPNTATRFSLTDKERMALCCYCVFECSKLKAFELAHPELSGTPAVQKKKCEEFFSSSSVVNFLYEYRAYLDSVLAESEPIEAETTSKEAIISGDREAMIREAMEMLADDLMEQIYAMRSGAKDIDRETILKMVDRIGWLKDEEKAQEAPRRYLPESCSSCRYKQWIEENCEEA